MRSVFYFIVSCLILSSQIFPQVNFTSSNLPIVIINTGSIEIPDEPKIGANMLVINNGEGRTNYVTDSVYDYNGKIAIEIRGQSSQQFPKKQYGFETRDSSDNDLEVSLLGMPSESDWILYAPYSDKTMMRNVLSYKLSNDLGRYATRTKFCELVLNGEYRGIYILMEKIKRGKGRVNIKKLEAKDTVGDALTGGYIFKIDKLDSGQDQGWYSQYKGYSDDVSNVLYLFSYPDQDKIVNAQKVYIKSIMDKFEYTMNKATYNYPINGYYDLMDMDTFVDTYLLNELCKNVDAYRLSTYFYKDKDSQGGRIKYGPIWDFDLSLGNANYDNASLTSGWEVQNKNASSGNHGPSWTRRLMTDPVFFNSFTKRWNEIKSTIFGVNNIFSFLDSVAMQISDARIRNYAKWTNVIGTWVWPNNYVGKTYEEDVQYLKTWISNRMIWMNNNIPTAYSDITWLTPDLTNVNFEQGNKAVISSNNFYKDTLNVDSVTFVSSSDTLKIRNAKDSISLIVSGPGNFIIRGAAWHNNKMVVVSPAYKITSTVTSIAKEKTIPTEYKLFQNFPNPFNPSTTISWQLAAPGFVTLKIYDVLGNEVATLVNEMQNAGTHFISFNYQLPAGIRALTSGIYFYRLQAGNFISTRKMVFLK